MRLIRPSLVARVCALLLGLSVCRAVRGAGRSEEHAQTGHVSEPRRPDYQAPARLFRLRLQSPQGPSRPCPRRRARPRNLADASAPGSDDAAVQDRRERRPRAGRARRRRDRVQPGDRAGALGRARAGQALDRQHHEGDDRGRVPGRQPRPLGDRHRRAQRRLRRVDDVSQSERADHARERPAPHAHRLRQRRRAHPRACLARRDGVLRRADEREGAGARASRARRSPIRRG